MGCPLCGLQCFGEAEPSPQECERFISEELVVVTAQSSTAQVKSWACPQVCGRAWAPAHVDK